MHFLLKDPLLHRDVERRVCVGAFEAAASDYLRGHADKPVHFIDTLPELGRLQRAPLFVSEAHDDVVIDDTLRSAAQLQVVHKRDLCARFDL